MNLEICKKKVKSLVGRMKETVQSHPTIFLAVGIILAVALVVCGALFFYQSRTEKAAEVIVEVEEEEEAEEVYVYEPDADAALTLNNDTALWTLMETYYTAAAEGDLETIESICTGMLEVDLLRCQENAYYIASYDVKAIYTKPGYEEDALIAFVSTELIFTGYEDIAFPGYQAYYVSTDENGELYINRGTLSDEANEYISLVTGKDDVIAFNNEIAVAYNTLILENPDLLTYITEVESEVSRAVGEVIAAAATEEEAEDAEDIDESEDTALANATADETAEETTEEVTSYVTATTTVNVRTSDSELADKLGKVSSGTKLELIAHQVNGWSKIIYEGTEGYIKTEYLLDVESVSNVSIIGTVTALENVNVRSAASETADRLGVLAGGESASLIENDGTWCKIIFGTQVGYVKAAYVE